MGISYRSIENYSKFDRILSYISPNPTCRDGGTGRRTGLKIPRSKDHEGSTPSLGTKKQPFLRVVFNCCTYCLGKYFLNILFKIKPTRTPTIAPAKISEGQCMPTKTLAKTIHKLAI